MENKPPLKASMVQNQYGERLIKIVFPYEITLLNKIRSLAGREYNMKHKFWTAPIYIETLESLILWGFTLDKNLIRFIEKVKKQRQLIQIEGIEGLKGELFPFQYLGVSFIETNKGRALIADEMGLGKTIQALAWLQLHRDLSPVVVVVPASLKLNWKREAEKWLPYPKVEILYGKLPWKPIGKIIVINYDILWDWRQMIRLIQPKVIITDECHYYKNSAARRTKAVKYIAKNVNNIIALSGTPIVNRPIEAFNAINIINPELFPKRMDFAFTFCGARHNGYGWDFNGATNTERLHKILTDSIMIRRLKKDVLPELPDKQYSFVPIELDNKQEYDHAERDFIEYIRNKSGKKFEDAYKVTENKLKAELKGFMEKYKIKNINFGEHNLDIDEAKKAYQSTQVNKAAAAETLTQIELLKQLAVKGALKESIAWIENFIEIENKLVIFATHRFVIDELMNHFPKIAVRIDGRTPMKDRQRAVDVFQHNPKVKLFIGNIQAAGVGITLTAASNVVFLELPWTPGALVQAIDRVHRIGQKDSVNVYYLFAVNTIMEKIANLIDRKQKILAEVLDGKKLDSGSLLSELMNEYKL